MTQKNIAASVRARLLNKARVNRLDFNLLLTRYALERLLYRLSLSEHCGQFVLKGALLFDIWFDLPHRPTHDADLLGYGASDLAHLETVFRDISQLDCDDGVLFQAESVRATEIRKEANYDMPPPPGSTFVTVGRCAHRPMHRCASLPPGLPKKRFGWRTRIRPESAASGADGFNPQRDGQASSAPLPDYDHRSWPNTARHLSPQAGR